MHVSDYEKNKDNAIKAKALKIGDRVKVIATGQTGTVTKKIEYDRKNHNVSSPYGYTTIQVRFDNYEALPHHKKIRHFSARSLERIRTA